MVSNGKVLDEYLVGKNLKGNWLVLTCSEIIIPQFFRRDWRKSRKISARVTVVPVSVIVMCLLNRSVTAGEKKIPSLEKLSGVGIKKNYFFHLVSTWSQVVTQFYFPGHLTCRIITEWGTVRPYIHSGKGVEEYIFTLPVSACHWTVLTITPKSEWNYIFQIVILKSFQINCCTLFARLWVCPVLRIHHHHHHLAL